MVKKGYKQTEAGLIPEDWDTITFRDCFEILPNNTLSRAELNYNGGKVKNIHYGDVLIKFPSVLDCSNEMLPYVNPECVSKCSTMVLQDGDIIIADTAEDNTVGKATEVIGIGEQRIVSGLHTIPCRPKQKDRFADKWLGYFINHSVYHNQLLPFITGIKVSSISKSAIADTIIAIPEKAEQERIVAALSDMDELILSLEKFIEKKRIIKQGAIQDLLSAHIRIMNNAIDWIEVELGNIGYLIKSTVNPQLNPDTVYSEYSMPAYDENKQPAFTQGKDMHSNRIGIHGSVLLFNKLNVRQKRVWFVKECEDNSVCSTEFLPYCSDAIDLRLLAQILLTDEVTTYFVDSSTGTSNSQKRITPSIFMSYSVKIPADRNEQKVIGDILEDMDSEIDSLHSKLEKYRQMKSGMMDALLTGKVRLV
ncbi:MAG: restriction endonuclease subunit S [Ruminiclostridium sp.]